MASAAVVTAIGAYVKVSGRRLKARFTDPSTKRQVVVDFKWHGDPPPQIIALLERLSDS
jgi:hypothetical protein